MCKSVKLVIVLSSAMLTAALVFAAVETQPLKSAIKQSGRRIKSISRHLNASGEPVWPEAMKLNQTRLVPAGHTEAIDVKLTQRRYWCELADADGKPLDRQYAVVSTLRAVSPTSSYSFSFCSPKAMFEVSHTFRLFSHGAGRNYLVWTQNRFIFLVEVSKGNDRTETLMRHLCFHDPDRLARQKAITKKMFGKKVKVDLYDYLWRTQVSLLVPQDFGLMRMPEIINTNVLIDEEEYGLSRNSILDQLFVISMSISKTGAKSLQFAGPKLDKIYTVARKDGKWRLTGKEPLTKAINAKIWRLLRDY